MVILPTAPAAALIGSLLFGSLAPSNSYPTGAATCLAGDAAPGGPHSGTLKGSLSDGGYAVDIDGSLIAGEPITAGAMRTLKISGSGAMFKGFLIRMSSGGKDLSGSLTTLNSPDIQIMASTGEATGQFPDAGKCAMDVAGATHTNKDDKTEVSAGVMVPTNAVGEIDVEITVVMDKANYYYSPFKLTVEEESFSTPDPTEEPTSMQPTSSPVVTTGDPTSMPTATSATIMNATDEATMMPANMSNMTNMTNMTEQPTAMPVNMTDEPTASPVNATDEPTAAPVNGTVNTTDAAAYDCETNNPCSPENLAQNLVYFPAADPDQFIQCGAGDQCFVQDCALGTKWDQSSTICVTKGVDYYLEILCTSLNLTVLCP